MYMIAERRGLEDFNRFCATFDVKKVIAAAEEHGDAVGYEKEVYALAILRAVHNGDFGRDKEVSQAAISALWERGYRKGFNLDSFNEVFQELFVHW